MRTIWHGRRNRKPIQANKIPEIAEDAHFLGPRGRPLDRSGVRKTVAGYGRKAGIEGVRVSPHTLRHTFAVLYIRNGGDSFSLQEILGHSTLEMTRRYVHLARRDISEQHKKFSPMDSISGCCLVKHVSVYKVVNVCYNEPCSQMVIGWN